MNLFYLALTTLDKTYYVVLKKTERFLKTTFYTRKRNLIHKNTTLDKQNLARYCEYMFIISEECCVWVSFIT